MAVIEHALLPVRAGSEAGFEAAFAEALQPGAPMLIHVKLDADVSTSRTTPGAFWPARMPLIIELWLRASLNTIRPGRTRRPLRSITRVFGPACAMISLSVPTARNFPSLIATALAVGLVGASGVAQAHHNDWAAPLVGGALGGYALGTVVSDYSHKSEAPSTTYVEEPAPVYYTPAPAPARKNEFLAR